MGLLRAALLTLLTAAFVAMPAQGFARISYFCHMTGAVSERCCCADEHELQPRSAQLQAPDCCDLLKAESNAAAPATRVASHDAPPAVMVLAIASALLADAQMAQQPGEPPTLDTHPPGPPRFLVHCSFLI